MYSVFFGIFYTSSINHAVHNITNRLKSASCKRFLIQSFPNNFLIFFVTSSTIRTNRGAKMKKIIIGIAAVQLLIVLTMLVRSEPFSLLSYINNSFIYGGILVFFGAWVFVIRTGVFDVFTMSMRKFFKSKSTLDDDEMRLPSEVLAFSSSPLLIVGGATLVAMGISLAIYQS